MRGRKAASRGQKEVGGSSDCKPKDQDEGMAACNKPDGGRAVMRWSKKARSSSLSFSNAAKAYFSNASANAALSERSANAISGSIIENSARWRLVFEFSARKVGPKV